MKHVATMNKRFGDLIPKILSGEKEIESRWSKNKIAPWNRVKTKVRQFERKDFGKARQLFPVPDEWTRGKNYCVLMWLKNPKKVSPFRINKSGFGSAVAWLTVKSMDKLGLVNGY